MKNKLGYSGHVWGGGADFIKFNENVTESDIFQDIGPQIRFMAQYYHQ